MKLQPSYSSNNLSLLEPMWFFGALLIFSAGPAHGTSIVAGLGLLSFSFLQNRGLTGRLIRATPFDAPWTLLLAGAVVGLWASYDANLGLPVLLTLAGSIALFYTAANAPRPEVLAQVTLLVGVAVAAFFLTQHWYNLWADRSSLASFLSRAISWPLPDLGSWKPFPNSIATLLEGLIPVGLAFALTSRSPRWQLFSGAATGIMGLAVLFTASRGAWVALAVGGIFWLSSRWRGAIALLVAVVLVALVVLGAYLTLSESATPTDIPIVGPILYQLFARPDRLSVYQGALYLIQDFPLTGIGLGGVFAMVYSKYVLLISHPFLTYSHNLYLSVWLRHGLLGIIGMAWLVVTFGYLVSRERRAGRTAPLFQAAWTGVTVTLVHGLFDARQYVDLWTMWPLFVLLGLVVSTRTIGSEKAVREISPPQPKRWIALGLLIVGCVIIWRPLAAMACVNFGAVKQAQAELGTSLSQGRKSAYLQAAMDSYECALRLDPDNRTAHLRLGVLHTEAGRYEEAISHLEAALQSNPQNATTHKALGLAYMWMGRLSEAEPLLANVPDIVEELNVWGGWRAQQGERVLAKNALQMSLRLDPEQSHVQRALAALEAQ